jgi:hypothetical protein
MKNLDKKNHMLNKTNSYYDYIYAPLILNAMYTSGVKFFQLSFSILMQCISVKLRYVFLSNARTNNGIKRHYLIPRVSFPHANIKRLLHSLAAPLPSGNAF